jgi:predicted RNA-binding Zn-ribbon protein involved in translation (DUF1610 family)
MNPPMHHIFRCPNCQRRIQLPQQTLGDTVGIPTPHSTAISSAAFPCPDCKQVRLYALDGDSSHGQTSYDTAWEFPPEALPSPQVELSHEKATCKCHVWFLAQWSETTSVQAKRADIKTWIWEHLLCPHGYKLLEPDFRVRE